MLPEKIENYEDSVSEIIINEDLKEALDGIEDNSHIEVLFWMNRLPQEERNIKKVHPERREELPLVGIFTTRSPTRPNPIGLTVVELLERRGNILKVKGLDALNKTPVIDIKPFNFPYELTNKVKRPWWYEKLIRKES